MSRFTPNYYIACRLQERILNTVGVEPQSRKRVDPALKAELSPSELASLVKAWDTLEDRKRILRNKPLPKAADVTPKTGRERKALTFRE